VRACEGIKREASERVYEATSLMLQYGGWASMIEMRMRVSRRVGKEMSEVCDVCEPGDRKM
jgi:hypothetical protein